MGNIDLENILLSNRIGAMADLTGITNFPIVLDSGHPATKLLIQHHHSRVIHANNETVVKQMRQLWILNLRSAVRCEAHDCELCKINRVRAPSPPIRNLPPAHLAYYRQPFSFVGLDYFGPAQVSIGRRHEKRDSICRRLQVSTTIVWPRGSTFCD